MPRKSAIRPEDIYELRQPLQSRLSPQGDRLVVVVSQANRETLKNQSHLWMVKLNGQDGQNGRVRQFTQGKTSDSNPRWSPDGSIVAFLSNRSGKAELWTIAADGGEARPLTKLEGSISDFDWHPNGRRLVVAFCPQDAEAKVRAEMKKRGEPGFESPRVREVGRIFYKLDGAGFLPSGRTHLWLVDAETGKARQLTTEDGFDEGEPRFSPDGKWIYFVSNRSKDPDLDFQRLDIWRIPARGGRLDKVRNFDGPTSNVSFSRDGKWITFLGTRDHKAPWNQHHTKLWMTRASGGRPVELTQKLDRSCENSTISDTYGLSGTTPAIWSPDGKWVYFLVTTEGNTEVWRVSPKDKKPEPVLNQPGAVIDFSIDFEGGWIHCAWSDWSNPGEVRSDPLPNPSHRGGQVVALPSRAHLPKAKIQTGFNREWLSRRGVAVPDEIWFTSGGSHRLQGWILNPKRLNRGRKYPGLLYIHGGPATQYGRIFFHEFQVLAARGYVVFYCNPRGGTGYTEKHLNAIVNRWGTVDYDDLMRFTDTVVRRTRHLDGRRLGVAGGSYGGFMTNWIIGHTNRFACAVTSRSISNLMSFVGSSDFGYAWPQEFGSDSPWEDPKHYLKMSPLTYLRRMRTPTLIDHQEEDHRCPIEQAEQLWAALKAKGVPCSFLRYPGEPHGMSRGGRPDRRIHRLEKIVSWLDQWTRR